MWRGRLAEVEALNNSLLSHGHSDEVHTTIADISEDELGPSGISNENLRALVQGCIVHQQQPTYEQLHELLKALGMDRPHRHGRISNEENKAKLLIGMQRIFEYHFGNYDKAERANIMGELLFNGEMFGKEAGIKVAEKIAKSVTSRLFSPSNIL